MLLNLKFDKNNSRKEHHAIPDPGTSSAQRKSENRRQCRLQFEKNQHLFRKNFFCTNHSTQPYILFRFSTCLLSILFLLYTMQKYFPSCYPPNPEQLSEYFFAPQQASNCVWGQFHNIVPARRSTTFCTCIHAENNAHFYHLHLSIFYECVAAICETLPLRVCKYQ